MQSGDIDSAFDQATSLLTSAEEPFRERDFARSELLYRQALEILWVSAPHDHPDVATCLERLGQIYFNWSQYELAIPMYERLLDIGKQVLGNNNPAIISSYRQLARAYEGAGRLDDA